MAESLIKPGVPKSGSPTLNPIISIPLFFNSLAFADISSVADAGNSFILFDKDFFIYKFFININCSILMSK